MNARGLQLIVSILRQQQGRGELEERLLLHGCRAAAGSTARALLRAALPLLCAARGRPPFLAMTLRSSDSSIRQWRIACSAAVSKPRTAAAGCRSGRQHAPNRC